MIEINVAKDFSITPGGRYMKEGPFSGEQFRLEHLKPKFLEARKTLEKLLINMDGCFGYPSSFIDESFGKLARELGDKNILNEMVIISNDQPSLVDYINECIRKG